MALVTAISCCSTFREHCAGNGAGKSNVIKVIGLIPLIQYLTKVSTPLTFDSQLSIYIYIYIYILYIYYISRDNTIDMKLGYISKCSCGSVVEHCISNAKVVGSIPREQHTDNKYMGLNAL